MTLATKYLVFSLVLALAAIGFAQSGGAVRSVTHSIIPVDGSGVSGYVFIGDFGANTVVVIALTGTSGIHPAHVHAGNCGASGNIVVPLQRVSGDSGLSVTIADTPYEAIINGDHYVNIHQSPEHPEIIVACGEVGAGAAGLLGAAADMQAAPTPSDGMQATNAPTETLVQAEEFSAPQTASYGLFAVGGSGVEGQLQIVEEATGETRLVLSLRGAASDQAYPAAIYEGDCGPDRPLALRLEAVGGGSVPNDALASETLSADHAFGDLTTGNYFAYVFTPGDTIDSPEVFGLDAPVLACGEVGQGANR